MKKKKLDLSELKVESFATKGELKEREGTVKAHGWFDTWAADCHDSEYDCPSVGWTDCTDCPTAIPTGVCTCRGPGTCSPEYCQFA